MLWGGTQWLTADERDWGTCVLFAELLVVKKDVRSSQDSNLGPLNSRKEKWFRSVSMDKYHLSSAPMPELQWLSW